MPSWHVPPPTRGGVQDLPAWHMAAGGEPGNLPGLRQRVCARELPDRDLLPDIEPSVHPLSKGVQLCGWAWCHGKGVRRRVVSMTLWRSPPMSARSLRVGGYRGPAMGR